MYVIAFNFEVFSKHDVLYIVRNRKGRLYCTVVGTYSGEHTQAALCFSSIMKALIIRADVVCNGVTLCYSPYYFLNP